MRNTKQKDLVLNIINTSTAHLNAESIYNIAKLNMPNISLGTIYRNLNQLVETNKIMRIKMNDGIDRFDSISIKHNHFICNKCEKIIDIFNDYDIDISFFPEGKVLDYEIKFKGICSDCLKKEE